MGLCHDYAQLTKQDGACSMHNDASIMHDYVFL